MSQIFFSGIDRSSQIYLLAGEQATGMISFLDWSSPIRWALDDTALTFALDSGAYSKTLTREDIQQYASIIELMGDRAMWYAAPDKIGDQAQSNRNYEYLLSLLPLWLRQHILWVYQVGADLSYLHQGLEKHQRIGIGGLVSLLKKDPARAECMRKKELYTRK